MTSTAAPSLAGSDEVRHKKQQSQDSGAYLDWNPDDATPGPVSSDFVTVVAIAGDTSPPKAHVTATTSSTPFVTVLSIGTPAQESSRRLPDGSEEVPVYRLPGERLGFGLKFEGGTADVVRRLFIQSCASDSPASRVCCSWGRLRESDEILEIDGVPVAAMTKVQCVQRMKESKVVMRLVVRKGESPFIIGEVKKTAAPPPIPPRKGKVRQENKAPTAPPPPPDGFADDRRPPEPEVYTDILSLESCYRRRDSESDDTGSSLSTVVERSVPTSTSSSGVSIDLARVLGPFEQLEREFGVPQLMSSSGSVLQPPLNFQDAPLSSVEEKVNVTLPLRNNDPDDAEDGEDVEDEPLFVSPTSSRGRGKKRPPPPPPPSPRARPTPPPVPPPVPAPRSPTHLPRLIDFVPKESMTSHETPNAQPSTKVPALEASTEEGTDETSIPSDIIESSSAASEVDNEDDGVLMIRLPDVVDSPDDIHIIPNDVDRIDGGSFGVTCSSPLPTIGEDEEEAVDSERAASTTSGVIPEIVAVTPSAETVITSDHNNNFLQERSLDGRELHATVENNDHLTTFADSPPSLAPVRSAPSAASATSVVLPLSPAPSPSTESSPSAPSAASATSAASADLAPSASVASPSESVLYAPRKLHVPEAPEERCEVIAVIPTTHLDEDGSSSASGVNESESAYSMPVPMPIPWPATVPTQSNDASYPRVATGMDGAQIGTDDGLSPAPPPSYSRLPPDGDEFPPRYQDSDATEMTTRPGQPSTFDEVLKSSERSPSNGTTSAPSRNGTVPIWRKDERSERSVRDKIAMFTSGVTSASPSQLAPCPTKSPLSRATSFTAPPPRPTDAATLGDDARRASLHALVEQRRKSISKLRGLVIPEAKAAPTICDLPVIPCDTSLAPPPVIPTTTRPPLPRVDPTPSLLSSAPWRAPSNLPKYSPAFKRKSLSIRKSDVTSRCRADVISVDIPDGIKLLQSEDSDNDSAVSSSRSSISPPSSPLPTAGSVDSTHDSNRRVLKPRTVDAINRKNVLFSARCRSGRDVKAGSPQIRRKFSDDEEKHCPESSASLLDTRTPVALRRDPREEIRELERMVNSLDVVLGNSPNFSRSVSDEALPPSSERIHFRPATLQDLPSDDVKVAFFSDFNLLEEPRASSPVTTSNPSPDSSPSTHVGKQRTASSPHIFDRVSTAGIANSRSSLPVFSNSKTAVSVFDIRKAFEKSEMSSSNEKSALGVSGTSNGTSAHVRMSSMDSTTSDDGSLGPRHREQYGSISSLASTTSLISQQELQQLIDEANQTLEESNSNIPATELLVVIVHRDSAGGSVGITLAGGADYETKEITVHKVLAGSPAERDGRLQKGDRILSINGRNMKGVTHRESLAILKAPRPEVVLVISRCRNNGGRPSMNDAAFSNMKNSRPLRIPEQSFPGSEMNLGAKGPPQDVVLTKDGAGLGFSLEGGKDSPIGDRPLTIKKIFTGGSAEKSGYLHAGDELLSVNDIDVTHISRIEAWGLMKRLKNGPVTLKVRRAATAPS